jgi:hypothetical protein
MNLSPAIQQAIEEIASSQGISAEQFIVQTLIEKISSCQQPVLSNSDTQSGLREKDDVLVFDTESLDHIDFNALISQSREERELEQIDL